MTVTINAPDQVHAFLELWERRNELSELKDIHQSVDGLVHTFTFAEMPLKDITPDAAERERQRQLANAADRASIEEIRKETGTVKVQSIEPPCGLVELPSHEWTASQFESKTPDKSFGEFKKDLLDNK